MTRQLDISPKEIRKRIRSGDIRWAGHGQFKIFGKLNCASGKRMKKENRVFFKTSANARQLGFRPCGHCMRDAYEAWKRNA